MLREDQNSLYVVLDNHISSTVLTKKNKNRSWQYGYNPQYDIVVISRSGTVGEIYNINGINVALPETPKKVYSRNEKKSQQYWEPK